MKRIIIYYIVIVSVFFNIHILHAEHLMSLFLKPYPVIDKKQASEKLSAKLHKPGKLVRTSVKQSIPTKVSGIFATYAGFLTTSDLNGEIAFPRKHSAAFAYLLVTEKITPLVMSGNTIHHWELIKDTPADFYKIDRQYDEDTQLYYWQVTNEPFPPDNVIPLETIIIFANPKYIEVPLGITPLIPSPNLLLPDVYVKNGLNIELDSLYVLNLNQYFGPIFFLYKRDTLRYSSHLTY